MKRIKYWLNNYFILNKRERNGVLILCSLVFVLLLIKIFQREINSIVNEEETYVNSIKDLQFDSIQTESNYKTLYTKSDNKYKKKDELREAHYFKFNPNNLAVEQWMELGLSDFQIRIIKNFEQKGGKFFNKEDLKKIYSIKPEQYAKLEPFIEIPKTENNFQKQEAKKIEPLIVDLNTADESELEKLPLIGPALSERIIKYRDALGGFIKPEQLKEVFGIDSTTIDKIMPFVKANIYLVEKININKCTIEQLKKHPYLNYNIARSIVLMKDRFGPYKNIEDIKKSVLINNDIYTKIQPYITVN